MRRDPGTLAGTFFVTVALAAAVCAPATGHAAPVTAAIRAKQQQAAEAASKLQDLNDDLEMKVEDYNEVAEALQDTRAKLVATEAELTRTEARLAASQEVLSSRADAMYRGGSVDLLEVLLGTTDFNDFLSRIDILNRISGADADLVSSVSIERARVDTSRASLENRQNEQTALRNQAAAKKKAVETAVKNQASFVASLNKEIAGLVKAERERLARVAAELARQAAAKRGTTRRAAPRTTDLGNLGEPHSGALDVAKRYVGVPYVWGGTSPSGFDCSGLMQYAYREVGVSLPRTSRSQFRVGAFIPADRTDLLEPGDLVFFGYGGDPARIHHVGMYAGNGVFLHAPGTGDRVKYSSLTDRISQRADYVGGVRP